MSDQQLTVLLLESERGASAVAAHELTEQGHVVLRCHEPGAPSVPCAALAEGKRCPLDAAVVDVALDVRSSARPQPTPLEDGVRCALVRRVPVVIAGHVALNPYDDYATEVHAGTEDVVSACERAAAALLTRHTTIANDALAALADQHSITNAPTSSVHRRNGALLVRIAADEALDAPLRSFAAARVLAALRAFDTHARGIDVVFDAR